MISELLLYLLRNSKRPWIMKFFKQILLLRIRIFRMIRTLELTYCNNLTCSFPLAKGVKVPNIWMRTIKYVRIKHRLFVSRNSRLDQNASMWLLQSTPTWFILSFSHIVVFFSPTQRLLLLWFSLILPSLEQVQSWHFFLISSCWLNITL